VEIKAGPAFPKRTKTQDCILARTTIWLNFPKSRRDRWQPPLLGKRFYGRSSCFLFQVK